MTARKSTRITARAYRVLSRSSDGRVAVVRVRLWRGEKLDEATYMLERLPAGAVRWQKLGSAVRYMVYENNCTCNGFSRSRRHFCKHAELTSKIFPKEKRC